MLERRGLRVNGQELGATFNPPARLDRQAFLPRPVLVVIFALVTRITEATMIALPIRIVAIERLVEDQPPQKTPRPRDSRRRRWRTLELGACRSSQM